MTLLALQLILDGVNWMRGTMLAGLTAVIPAVGCTADESVGASGRGDDAETGTDGFDATGNDESAAEAGDADADGGNTQGCNSIPGNLAAAEGTFIEQGSTVDGTRPSCDGVLHATAGASGSILRVGLDAWPDSTATIRVDTILGEPLVDWTVTGEGGSVDVELQQSGEVMVRVEPIEVDAPSNAYTLSVTCVEGCDREYTRYPVVFMHGMAGTDAYFDVLDYWFRVEPYVSDPGYLVRMPTVDAFETTAVRAQQWRAHLDELAAEGVGRRFNLIAHSQGGLDARYIASKLDPDHQVASIITVASPHQGSAVADVAAGVFDQFPIGTAVIEGALAALGGLIGLSGSALADQVADFSRPAMVKFNAEVLDVPGVYYASWAGRSCAALDLVCRAGNSGEAVESVFEPTLDLLNLTDGPNDGLVPVESAKWGEYMGELPADHMDEVGQIADLVNGAFDHRAFYLDELRRLAAKGL